MADLHPDIVAAIRDLSGTKLGRRYDKFTRKRYGKRGTIVAGKTVSAEFGGRRTKGNRDVVSSAGARGPAQFIASTRDAYIKQYGVDPWKNDKQAIKGLMLHQLNTGIEGYNPGMPTYKGLVLGQKLNAEDRRALKNGGGSATVTGPGRTEVSSQTRTIPGQSFEEERRGARRELLLGGDITLKRLLEYKGSINSLQDVPDRKVRGDLKVTHKGGQKFKVPVGEKVNGPEAGVKGGIYEVFYDPLNKYWDSGGVRKGAIGGHGDHVHVSADKHFVEALGKHAQQLGLHVSGQDKFGGRPSSGHTDGSFHYKGMGIDVSGDPAAMRKFARIALREARRGRGR